MSRISARSFIGTRARFQRLRDAKFFNGWIEDFSGNRLSISTHNQHAVELGDEFRFEGFGHHISVVFNARLDHIGQLDLGAAGAMVSQIEGSNVQVIEACRTTFDFTVTSPIRFAASNESVRMQMPEIYTTIDFEGRTIETFTIDVGPQGIGVILREPLPHHAMVDVTVETRLGAVNAAGCVRYCRKDPDRAGMMRCGIMFTDLGRMEKPRWERFLRDLS
ncbi:MAG: PilZ domain-containing protein [Fimbriimonadaceae bacterium]|nr:PilZ domain-containing protein [Fimbriimonadaceae bacterium]